jgi:hypothetical protein
MWDIPKYWLVAFGIGCAFLLLLLAWITIFVPLFNQADYNNFNIEEQLDRAERMGILSALKCSVKMATIYKLTFAHRIACLMSEVQP